ncbi:MAG TPA: macro domain-containing protein [candidate division Zixibacteria bacterium]|nr:macro domain-containing protein [candidate division Zixibacteria bacterium]
MPFTIEVVKGDITRANVEAIVNAANNALWMGSGVAGAIKAAGGESVEKDAMSKGPIIPGEAVFSTAGRLPYKMVIHAAVMGQDLRTNDRLIRQATVACLNLAEKHRIKSIAFPAFGTGVGGFPMAACANLMTAVARGYSPLCKEIERVQFCLFDEYGLQAFQKAMTKPA